MKHSPAVFAVLIGGLIPVDGQIFGFDSPIDGSGNGGDPSWGMSETFYERLSGFHYGVGDTVKVVGPSGNLLPNARAVSNAIAQGSGSPRPNSLNMSNMVWQWGQIIDHDITQTPNEHGEVHMIAPVDSLGVIPMTRSESTTNLGATTTLRNQFNEQTAYLDGSAVYGASLARLTTLFGAEGRLRTNGNGLLPYDTGLQGFDNDTGGFDSQTFFFAGDSRANEQPGLTSMHTLLMWEHNRLADEISAAGLYGPGEVFFRARAKLQAEIQAITYNEFLPAVLGSAAPTLSMSSTFDPTVNASVTNEFAAVVFRFGHSMVPSAVDRRDPQGNLISSQTLTSTFFNTPLDITEREDVEEFLSGLVHSAAEELDNVIVPDLRSMLFGPAGGGGLDLAALNIERGRDHGLGSYNEIRTGYGLAVATSFSDISSDIQVQLALESVYTDVDDVDAWIGALAEDQVSGSLFGELMIAGMVDQFTRLRDGDRYFFSHNINGFFTDEEMEELMNFRMADLLEMHTDMENLGNVFFIPEPGTTVLLILGAALGFRRRRE